MNFSFPKIELHLHIDCSLSFAFVSKYIPGISKEDYSKTYNAPVNCCSLIDYLACAQAAIQLMQTREQLYDATMDVIRQLEADHVIYAELRFAPLQHLHQGLTPEEVVEACLAAMEDYEGNVKVRMLLCTLRHFSKAESDLTADLVIKYHHRGVVGLDLAADEAGFGLENHQSAFEKVNLAGISCTSHAGEACGPESVWETIQKLNARRIGHGIRSVEDEDLMIKLKEADIHLEICPTSNHMTRVFHESANYPVNHLLLHDVSFGINTDGRAISNVTLGDEYRWLHTEKGWTLEDMFKVNSNAIHAAFIPEMEKDILMSQLRDGFERTNGFSN
jgi:adenosine deaminase